MKTRYVLAVGTLVTIICAAILLYMPAYLWIFPYLHDRTLSHFAEPFTSIPIPERTEVVDTLTAVGLLSGNSNHCDYLAARMVITDLPRTEIEKYYDDKYNGESTVRYFWFEDDQVTASGVTDSIAINPLREWVATHASSTKPNLIVYVYEDAMTSSIDYRCR